MSFGIAIQQAIYGQLIGHAPLMALVTDVYDDVPQALDSGAASAFPYVTIGEDVHQDWSTDTSLGDDATITIHTWSRYRGRKETKQIQGAIYDALTRVDLSVTGYKMVAIDFVDEQSFVDTDGLTRHGVSTFRVILDEMES